MAGEVQGTGKGFLTSSGELKDKKAIAAEDVKSKRPAEGTRSSANSTSEGASRSDLSRGNVQNALGAVRSRFNEEVNSFISVVNENDENLKKADENAKAQLEAARDLKEAIKENDSEKAQQKRDEIARLQQEREEIAKQTEETNNRRITDRRKSISLGNEQKGTVEVKPAQLPRAERPQSLENKEDVDKLIDSLKNERDAIKVQRNELKEVRNEVKAVVQDVRSQIEGIEKAAVRSVDEAEKVASKIASDIVRNGAQATVASNIDETVVKALVES